MTKDIGNDIKLIIESRCPCGISDDIISDLVKYIEEYGNEQIEKANQFIRDID